jgi:PKD repeat protein
MKKHLFFEKMPAAPSSFLRFRHLAALLGTVALVSPGHALDENLPWPYPQPAPFSQMLGDPTLTPDQTPPIWDETQVQESVNTGNPYTDYGHWRLNNQVYAAPWVIGREGNAPTQWTSAEKATWAQQWDQTQDWQSGLLLKYTLLRPPADAEPPPGGWPLVVINPGSGGVGSDGGPSTRWGSSYYREHYPAYVLNLHPQERTMDYLPDSVFTLPAFDAQFDLLDALLADPELNINERRVYVGGFSMGGSTTWLMILERPHFFAAAAPVSSRPLHTFEEAEQVMHLPIWMTTGHDDGGDGSANYLRAYQHLQSAGAEKIRFWEVQFTGHNPSAERLFHLPEWLFAQERPDNQSPQPEATLVMQGGLTVELDGSGSTDTDGTITRYDWDFGDGTDAATATASHTYAAPGEYTVSLRVRDNNNHFVTRYYALQVATNLLQINEPMVPGRLSFETPFNTEYLFSSAFFADAVSDPENDPLAAIRIETLPTKGNLLLDGVVVAQGEIIDAVDLANLSFLPTGNEGLDRFEYTVSDGFSWSPHDPGRVELVIGDPPPSALFSNLWTASSGEIGASTISIGAQYFSDDEGPVITELPAYLDGADNIRTTSSRTSTNGTADNQQTGTGTWIRFDLEQEATIYVAYDGRNTAIPAWLDDWEFVSSDEVKSWIYYDLYAKDFPAGSTVELGTNKAAPAAGGTNGYFIMGIPLGSSPEPEEGPPVLKLMMQSEGVLRLEWQGKAGHSYKVRTGTEFSDPGSWPILHQAPGVDGPMSFEPPSSSEPRRFWLIEEN